MLALGKPRRIKKMNLKATEPIARSYGMMLNVLDSCSFFASEMPFTIEVRQKLDYKKVRDGINIINIHESIRGEEGFVDP